MAVAPVTVSLTRGRGAEHLDLVGVLQHQESLGGVRLVETDPEIVHVVGWPGARRTTHAGPPWVLTPPRLSAGATDEQRRHLLAADAVVVRTSQQQDAVHAAGVPWYRLFVVPVAADATTFQRNGPAARNTERYRIVAESTGAADGMDTLLRALAAWERTELVVLAEQRAATLRREARRLGVAARFLAVRPRDEAERAWWIRSAHAAAVVPEQGAPARLALDAMACGVPVVATSVDHLEDLVVHGVTGLHVPVGDALSLARGLRALVSDPFRLEAFGMAAADRAVTRYSPERVGRDLLAVYRRVLAGQPEPDDADDAGEPDAAVEEGSLPARLDPAVR